MPARSAALSAASVVVVAALLSLAACRPSAPRSSLFDLSSAHPLTDHRISERRLTVLLHPAFEDCCPVQEIAAYQALERLEREHPDIEVFTVVPRDLPLGEGRFGRRFPGSRVSIASWWLVADGERAPRPRIEAWSRGGQLMLLRTLPINVTAEELRHQILWARSLSRPAAEGP